MFLDPNRNHGDLNIMDFLPKMSERTGSRIFYPFKVVGLICGKQRIRPNYLGMFLRKCMSFRNRSILNRSNRQIISCVFCPKAS